MKKFLMSKKFNKQSLEDFGMEYINGKYIYIQDESEWMKCQLYDFGWGKENGFYKLPIGDFEELIEIVLNDYDEEDSYGAAAIIEENYAKELKEYLLMLIHQNCTNNIMCKLNEIFHLDKAINRTIKEKMSIAEIQKEYNEWKKIAEFYLTK